MEFNPEEKFSNIKTLVEQMVKKNFGLGDDFNLSKLNKEQEFTKSKLNKNKSKFNSKNNMIKLITKSTKNIIKNYSDLKNVPTNLGINKVKRKTIQTLSKNNISEIGKFFKERNSNLLNANTNFNSNLNTNQNTLTNLNSHLNTNNNINSNVNNNINTNNNIINTNNNIINTNNNIINKNNINEEELYSNKNSEINDENQTISIASNNNLIYIKKNSENKIINDFKSIKENKNINENNNISDYKSIKDNNDINNINENNFIDERASFAPKMELKNDKEIGKIPSFSLTNIFNDSFGQINNYKNNSNYFNKAKKSRLTKLTLYEREILNCKRKNEKLEKKRKLLIYSKEKELKSIPDIDPVSTYIVSLKEEYIPIQERASELHNIKLSKIVINEESNRMKKKRQEEIIELAQKSKNRIFDKEKWENFIDRQNQWKNELQYKIKAAQIFRDNMNDIYFFKPKINNKSKSIIKDIQDEKNISIDEVFIRLYNDYEDHTERQKIRNELTLPTFRPKISKNNSQKIFFRNQKFLARCSTNPLINIINNNKKKRYEFNNNKNKKKFNKCKSQKLFFNLNNNIEKYSFIDKPNYHKKIFNSKKLINKNQVLTQPTKNTNNNFTKIKNDLIINKNIILKNHNLPKKNKFNKIKSELLFIPLKNKKKINKNLNKQEIEKEESNNNLNLDSNISKYEDNQNTKNNYSSNKLLEIINNEEGKSIFSQNKNNKEEIKKNKNQILPNNNKQDSNIFKKIELIKNKEKVEKYLGQSQREIIDRENSKFEDKKLYKINIRDSTPDMKRQYIILPSKNYSGFFNISDLDDEI